MPKVRNGTQERNPNLPTLELSSSKEPRSENSSNNDFKKGDPQKATSKNHLDNSIFYPQNTISLVRMFKIIRGASTEQSASRCRASCRNSFTRAEPSAPRVSKAQGARGGGGGRVDVTPLPWCCRVVVVVFVSPFYLPQKIKHLMGGWC